MKESLMENLKNGMVLQDMNDTRSRHRSLGREQEYGRDRYCDSSHRKEGARMKRLKILLVSEYFRPKATGGEVWSWGLCRELARRGHEVTVLTLKHDKALKSAETREGVRILRLSPTTRNTGSRLERWLAIRKFLRLAKREIDTQNPDVIHTVAFGLNVPVSRLAKRNGIPCITTLHSFFGKDWTRLLPAPWILRFAERRNVKDDASSVMTVPSSYLRRRVLKETGRGTVVVPNWCPDTFPKAKRFKVPTLVFVGSLEPVKNPLACVAAAKKLAMPLVVVGSGSLERRLLQEARRAGIALTILPRASRDETLSLIGGAAMVLVSSVTESFSLVALEAVAQGTPVAGTPVGIMPELPDVVRWPPKAVPKRLTSTQIAAVRNRFSKRKAVDGIERAYRGAIPQNV